MLELLAVVIILGIVATAVIPRVGRSVFAEFGAQAEGRKLSLSLLHAQRASIKTGDNHLVQFDGTTATSYQVLRRSGTDLLLVDGPYPISDDVTVTASSSEIEFTFEGQTAGLTPHTVDLVGENRSWQLSVIPITGSVSLQEQ